MARRNEGSGVFFDSALAHGDHCHGSLFATCPGRSRPWGLARLSCHRVREFRCHLAAVQTAIQAGVILAVKFFRDVRDDPEPPSLNLFNPRRLRFPVTSFFVCFLLLNGAVREFIHQCFSTPPPRWPPQGPEPAPFIMSVVLLLVSLPVALVVDLCRHWLGRLKRGRPSDRQTRLLRLSPVDCRALDSPSPGGKSSRPD